MKTCPFCAEQIQDAAIVCKHCKRDLPDAAVLPKSDDTNDDDEAKTLYHHVLEGIGEGDLADQSEISVSDAFRIANKLDVSVVERPLEFHLSYSMRDIDKLVDVSGSDWAAAMTAWRDSQDGLSTKGMIGWCAALLVSTLREVLRLAA